MFEFIVVLDLSVIILLLIALYKAIPFKNIEYEIREKIEEQENE